MIFTAGKFSRICGHHVDLTADLLFNGKVVGTIKESPHKDYSVFIECDDRTVASGHADMLDDAIREAVANAVTVRDFLVEIL